MFEWFDIYDYSHVWQISLLILLVEISDILIVIIWHVVSKFVYVAAKDCMGVGIAVAFLLPSLCRGMCGCFVLPRWNLTLR